MEAKRVTAIQGLFVRNWNNASPITITIQGTQEILDVPAFADAFLQVAATNRAKFMFNSAGAVEVPVVFFNVPISPLIIYSPSGGAPVTIGGTLAVTGTITAEPPDATPTAGLAHTITAGGTAVAVFTGLLNGGYIVNPDAATESLFVDEVNPPTVAAPGANGTTVELVAGQAQSFGPNTGTVWAIAATTAHTFTAVKRG
jgi:hypothetical protein